MRQRVDWKSFETSLETQYLGSSFETAADVEASANLVVEKIKEAQIRAMTLLPSSTSRRGDLPRASRGSCGSRAGCINYGRAARS
ncbi:hypothetical protein EVAR_80811_1 [Eumeta japonica]|uniref:Uncharacterized protein n=1 Tax=Eumeta variegata TaxID=151549 RepID=A0A4C1WDL7_EUMVA|nr:hypothetical protein EVAR_80811_1 [Eumeta japonica]